MSNWRIEDMDEGLDGDFEVEAPTLEHIVNEVIEVVNGHSHDLERTLTLNAQIVGEITDEINLMWSVIELPWWRKLRRTGRSRALALREKREQA